MATFIDKTGRIHIVHTQATGIALDETTLVYRVKNPGSETYEQPTGATFGFFDSSSDPTDLSMTVTDSLRVQVAVIDEGGEVQVAELSDRLDTTWDFTSVSLFGSRHRTETGISIAAGADSGGTTGLAYTGRGANPAEPGEVRYNKQNVNGTWVPGATVFTGDGAGIAPVLLTIPGVLQGVDPINRVIVAYDAVSDKIHLSHSNNNTRIWAPANVVGDAPNFARPGAAYHNDRLAVSWSELDGKINFATRQQRAGTSGNAFTHYDWVAETAVPHSQLGTNELFGNKVVLEMDAAGSPQIAFSRLLSGGLAARTTDVQVWRKFGNQGWAQAHREDFPATDSGLFNLTTGLDMATHLNGDPVVVYERDGGTNSMATVARPLSAPWTVVQEELLEEYGRSFAPALARGLGRDFHLVSGGASGALDPAFLNSKLISISPGGTSDVFIQSPGLTSGVTLANALTVTPDGTAHIVGLRGDSFSSTTGEVFYWSGPPSGPVTLRTAPRENAARLGSSTSSAAVILASDARGNLYLAYPTAAGAVIQLRDAGTGAWTVLHRISGNVNGLDFDVEDSGKFFLTYYDAGEDAVMAATNVNSKNGARIPFETYVAYDIGGGRIPGDTACALGPDSRPRIAFPQGGAMRFLVPRTSGVSRFRTEDAGRSANDSTLEMVVKGDRYHILSHSTHDGGTLNHLVVKDSGTISDHAMASPGLRIHHAFQRQAVSACLDAHGFPVMAVGVSQASFFEFPTVLLARLADSRDADGDGLPLLLEGAHCYDPDREDGPHDLAIGTASRFGNGVSQVFEFRRPDQPFYATSSGRRASDFNYDFETSVDLMNWEPEEEVIPEAVKLLNADLETSEGPSCKRSSLGFLYFPERAAAGPKRFGRLSIRRVR